MKYIFFLTLIFAAQFSSAQPDYTDYDRLLRRHVSKQGAVNYALLKTNKASLDSVARAFQAAPPQTSWPQNQQLAYWLNAYNLFTLKLMVENYPTTSIMNLDGGKTWDVKRIDIGGKKYSLNDIENNVIRPQFKDARIHFALNCAAKSCPPLHNEAFTAKNVQKLLENRTRAFVRSSAMNLSEKEVKISKIFEWYATDFGDLVAFLNRYSNVKIAPDAKILYQEYDWKLNQ